MASGNEEQSKSQIALLSRGTRSSARVLASSVLMRRAGVSAIQRVCQPVTARVGDSELVGGQAKGHELVGGSGHVKPGGYLFSLRS